MYSLAVIEVMKMSGHLSNIDEKIRLIDSLMYNFLIYVLFRMRNLEESEKFRPFLSGLQKKIQKKINDIIYTYGMN